MSGGFSVENIAREVVEAILKPSANANEIANLKKIAGSMNVNSWKARQIALVTTPGALAGSIGGPWGFAAMGADLVWLGKNAGQGCLGVGYALGENVDRNDIDLILAVWTKLVTPKNTVGPGEVAISTSDLSPWEGTAMKGSVVPSGKMASKLGVKPTAKLTGKIVAKKFAVKGGSKMGAKLVTFAVSTATTKLVAKLAAKAGTSWIPVFGGFVSGGVNWWLIDGLLNAAQRYYSHKYLIIEDPELADLA